MAKATQQAAKQAPATQNDKPMTPMEVFRKEVDLMKGQFQMILPSHMTLERFSRNLITAVMEVPALLECDRKSLWQEAMTAANLGLPVGSALQCAFILPFWDNKRGVRLAKLIPGYRGYIFLAQNSGEIDDVAAYEVCENDHFRYELGLHPRLEHRPVDGVPGAPPRGKITHAYCIVRNKGSGFPHIEVMSKAEIDANKARSRAKDDGPWKTDEAMMCRKTVIRRASRYMPLAVQKLAAIDNAIDMDARYELAGDGVVIHGQATEEKTDEKPAAAPSRLENFENQGEGKGSRATETEPASAPAAAPAKEEPQDAAPKQETAQAAAHEETGEEEAPTQNRWQVDSAATDKEFIKGFRELLAERVQSAEECDAVLEANEGRLSQIGRTMGQQTEVELRQSVGRRKKDFA